MHELVEFNDKKTKVTYALNTNNLLTSEQIGLEPCT